MLLTALSETAVVLVMPLDRCVFVHGWDRTTDVPPLDPDLRSRIELRPIEYPAAGAAHEVPVADEVAPPRLTIQFDQIDRQCGLRLVLADDLGALQPDDLGLTKALGEIRIRRKGCAHAGAP